MDLKTRYNRVPLASEMSQIVESLCRYIAQRNPMLEDDSLGRRRFHSVLFGRRLESTVPNPKIGKSNDEDAVNLLDDAPRWIRLIQNMAYDRGLL